MILNRGKKITSEDSDLKWGQRNFKSGQRLQIVSRGISNWGRNYKSVRNSNDVLNTETKVCSTEGNVVFVVVSFVSFIFKIF